MNASKRAAKGWKTRKDRKALEVYEQSLRQERRIYGQYAQADSLTGRRNRALAVGECVLKLMDALRELKAQKPLIDGTLFWTVSEQRIRDTDDKKGFHYTVLWKVKSDEDCYTEEEIRNEIEHVRQQMAEETEEIYSDDGPDEADLIPPFEPDPEGYADK